MTRSRPFGEAVGGLAHKRILYMISKVQHDDSSVARLCSGRKSGLMQVAEMVLLTLRYPSECDGATRQGLRRFNQGVASDSPKGKRRKQTMKTEKSL